MKETFLRPKKPKTQSDEGIFVTSFHLPSIWYANTHTSYTFPANSTLSVEYSLMSLSCQRSKCIRAITVRSAHMYYNLCAKHAPIVAPTSSWPGICRVIAQKKLLRRWENIPPLRKRCQCRTVWGAFVCTCDSRCIFACECGVRRACVCVS